MHRAAVGTGCLRVSVPAGSTLFQKWEKQQVMVTRRDVEANTGSVRKCIQVRGYNAMFYSLLPPRS